MVRINGKKKGNGFELKIAKQIASHIGLPYGKYVRRTPGSGSLLCRADLWVHEKYRERFPYFTELKFRKGATLDNCIRVNYEPYKWYSESKGKLPVDPEYKKEAPCLLIFKKNNMEPMVMLAQDVFESIRPLDPLYYPTFLMYMFALGMVVLPFDDFMDNYVKSYPLEDV